jgi:hypothetical protein
MVSRNEQVVNVIDEYIARKKGLAAMKRIHRRVFDEKLEAGIWRKVREQYSEMDWDDDTFEEFLYTAKEIVEGGLERIPEAYFDVERPENLTTERVASELDDYLFDDRESTSDEPDGFQYSLNDNGVINATYVYTDVSTDISATGQVERRVSEDSVSFRINPDQQLIIVESTYPPDVQRMKGVFRNKTNFAITICGNLTGDPDIANKRVNAFRESFPEVTRDDDADGRVRTEDDDGIPKLDDIVEIKLYNPSKEDEKIEKIDYEGQNLENHEYIEERQSEGYIVRGFTARVWYNGSPFDIAFSGSEMMGYAKVEEIGDYMTAQDLMDEIRAKYQEHIAA